MLMIAGSFWTGDFDSLAAAAARAFQRPLPADASDEARVHHAHLSGVALLSTLIASRKNRAGGWEAVDWTHDRAMRWIPNPQYVGDMEMDFAPGLNTFEISFRPEGAVA